MTWPATISGARIAAWSVGWIIAESATHIHVAANFGNIAEPEVEQFSARMAIPKKMILRMKRLPQLTPR